MPRRMPKRGPDGHFVKGDAQRVVEEKRPAGMAKAPRPASNEKRSGGAGEPTGETRQARHHVGSASIDKPDVRTLPAAARLAGRRCEECGSEIEETRVRVRGHVLYVGHCPRCTPDPLLTLQEG